MLEALAFFRGPLGKYVIGAAAVLFAVLTLIHIGANGVRKSDAKKLAVAQADVATHEAKAAQISASAGTQLQAQHTANAAKFAPLIAKVKTDVSDEADRDCRVPDAWGLLWRAGEAGADPGVSAAADLRHQGPASEAGAAPR